MILSIDLGTSSLKGALFLESRPLRSLGRFIYVTSDVMGWQQAISELFAKLSWPERADLEGIVISGQGPTIIPVMHYDQVAKPLFYYEAPSLKATDGGATSSHFLPKIAYALEQSPHWQDEVRYFMSAGDYIAYWLTGRAVTSLPNEAYRKLIWSDEEIRRYGINKELLPEYLKESVIETVSLEMRNRFSLQRPVVVYTTLFDFLAALLGSGSIMHGDALNRAGTSEGINFILNYAPNPSDLPKSEYGWRISPHILPSLYNIGTVFDGVGSLLERYQYDINEAEIQLHLAKVTRIWNEMKLIPIKEIKLCGGQAYQEGLTIIKQQLSHYPIKVLPYPYSELMGGAMYAMWLSGAYDSLEESVHYFASL